MNQQIINMKKKYLKEFKMFFKKKTINVDEYLKTLKKLKELRRKKYFVIDDDCSITKENEYLKIIDKYREENKYNIFSYFNERYRPYIKYGLISQISGKLGLISIFLYSFMIFNVFFNDSIFLYLFFFIIIMLLSSISIHMIYSEKYLIENEKYENEKKNPNWKRKQILNKILK